MKIVVGSKNEVKVNAVRELVEEYGFIKNAEVVSFEADSGVSKQPKSFEETLQGAKNRAKRAFGSCLCTFGMGIESGLMKAPFTNTGYMNFTCCAIYDGVNFHFGLSSAFEHSKEIMDLILNEGLEVNEAAHKSGITKNPKIGSTEGLISILTKGRLTRKEHTKQAIIMAFINLEK